MTTIEQLPKEVLLNIFDHFDPEDAFEFQWVGPAWYQAAHLKVLQEIDGLLRPDGMERFIESIDANPNPEYLKAVREIRISHYTFDWLPPVHYRLSEENAFKLFGRFPNLEKVDVDGDLMMFDNFDDDLCATILQQCPKLTEFVVEEEDMELRDYYKILLKLRLVLTRLYVKDAQFGQLHGTVKSFITSFPNLRELGDHTGHLNSFKELLPVFKNAPSLNQLSFCLTGTDNMNDTDNYINDFPTIKNTLSNITHVNIFWRRGISSDSFDFVRKYLTGLVVLEVDCNFRSRWTEEERRLFCGNTLDLIPFAKNMARYDYTINFRALSNILPVVVRKVLRQIPQPYTHKAKRILHIEINERSVAPVNRANLNLQVWRLMRGIIITTKNQLTITEITSKILNDALPILDVDRFKLDIERRGELEYYNRKATMEMYNILFRGLISVEEVYLAIPLTFVETELIPDAYNVLTKVERVVLHATADAKFQTLLDGFYYSFPNIKRLEIFYFSGIWKKEMGDFQLELPQYKLETLLLDVTTVRRKMKKDMTHFVLEVELLSNSKRLMYKVSIKDLSFTGMSDMTAVEGSERGKDYYRVHITTHSLKTLKLCINTSSFYPDDTENYNFDESRENNKKVTIFGDEKEPYIYKPSF